MRRSLLAALPACAIVLAVAPSDAAARPIRFLGPHPVAARFGGGYCYIEGPHVHAYAPDHHELYRDVGGRLVFAADPTPFGYDGEERHTFYGHHPIPVADAPPGAPVVYCYLDGPHVHPYAPPSGPTYRVDHDVAFYVGDFQPTYYREKPHLEPRYATIYRPYVAQRPVVEVQPPPEWHGTVWVAPPAVGAPGVVVQAPGVEVASPSVTVEGVPPPRVDVRVDAPPPPSVDVRVGVPAPVVVGAPGVYVGGPHVHVRGPGVVVGAPGPVVVGAPGVVVGGPGVVVGGRPHGHWEHEEREHEEHEHDEGWHGEREHHDNGKHKGWYK